MQQKTFAASRKTLQVVELKMRLLQYLNVLQLWRNVTSDTT